MRRAVCPLIIPLRVPFVFFAPSVRPAQTGFAPFAVQKPLNVTASARYEVVLIYEVFFAYPDVRVHVRPLLPREAALVYIQSCQQS